MAGLAVARSGGRIFFDADPLIRWGVLDPSAESLDLLLRAYLACNIACVKDHVPLLDLPEAAEAAIRTKAPAAPSRRSRALFSSAILASARRWDGA